MLENIRPILLEELGLRYYLNSNHNFGRFQCPYCSSSFEARISDIKASRIKSCGCLKVKHKMCDTKLYSVWENMHDRCRNPKHPQYLQYAGRGITICKEWVDSFISFYNWAVPAGYIEGIGLSLDRIDNDKGYSPDNCRWTTRNIQARNTRSIYITNTSGYRGVSWCNTRLKWRASIKVNNIYIGLGYFNLKEDAAKAYEYYVRFNNLTHNFTSILSDIEIEELYKIKEEEDDRSI